MRSNWTVKQLQEWDDKICEKAQSYGLDWFPISFADCNIIKNAKIVQKISE